MADIETRLGRPSHVSYRAVGSSTGKKEFVAGITDFGGSELPLSATELSESGGEVLHFPHVLGAISIFHSVPGDSRSGLRVNMTAEVLAKVFQRDITTWDHPEIVASNPNLNVPVNQNINVVHRVLGSSSTSLTSQYLSIAAADVWRLGQGSVLDWPADTTGMQGSSKVSAEIQATPFSIGYIDSGHGHADGLNEIRLRNKDGVFLDSKEADIGAAAEYASLPASHEAWTDVSLVNQAGPKTWPMTTFSYMLVRSDASPLGLSGALLKAYVQFMMSAEVQGEVGEFGFYPVPQIVLGINAAGIERIQLAPGQDDFQFETSTWAIAGHGENVISSKRGNYYDVRIDAISDYSQATASPSIQPSGLEVLKGDEYLESETADHSLAALIFAILACILSSYNLYYQCFKVNRSGYRAPEQMELGTNRVDVSISKQ